MLEIVLLILKIAGIIFASILGILIVLICVVLFAPVRYRGDFSAADGEEGEKKKIAANLRATWLLRLVRVYVTYEESARLRVKLLFFTLMDTAKEKRGREKRRQSKAERTGERNIEEGEKKSFAEQTEKASGREADTGKETGEVFGREADSRKETAESFAEKPGKEKEAESREKKSSDAESGEEGKQDEPKKGKRPKKEKRSIKSAISNILQTIRNFCDKLREIKKKAGELGELWNSDHMANSRSLLGKQFKYLLKHTKPKILSGYIRFGFEDPSTTGYAMAVYGILYPIWSPKLSVEPDFERQVLACHIMMKGRIRVWHLVRVALRMFLSRDVRRVIKEVKGLRAETGQAADVS